MEKKYLQFVEFKDLDNWSVTDLLLNKKIKEKFGISLGNLSDNEIRELLYSLLELTKGIFSYRLEGNNSIQRNISKIPNMKRDTLKKYVRELINIDYNSIILKAEAVIKVKELEIIKAKELLDSNFVKKLINK